MAPTFPLIHKRSAIYIPAPCEETTILVGPNGKLVTITFAYQHSPSQIIVRDYATGTQLASAQVPTNAGGGTAIVYAGLVHVFLASPFVGTANVILHGTFDANWALSSLATAYTAVSPDNVCNLGICASPYGFIMSVETQQAARQVFFLRSTDLVIWTPIGSPMATGAYVGSPKIYYSQRRDKFLLTLLLADGTTFYTTAAQLPATLGSYQVFAGPYVLLWPDGAGETLNTSDVTMAEQNGKTYLIYLDGTQTGAQYPNYRTAIFDGTLEQLWEAFFPLVVAAPPPPTSNLIPAMTGQTTNGVTVTASDMFANSSFYAWKVADRDPATFWHCNTALPYPHYLRTDFPSTQPPTSYTIKPRAGFPNQAPKNFTLKGLRVSDGAWVTVDTRTNQTYTDGAFNAFTLASPASYASFELVMDSNVEGSVNLSIGELELRG